MSNEMCNRFIRIIANNSGIFNLPAKEKRKKIDWILNDIKKTGIFDPIEEIENEDYDIEILANIIFNNSKLKKLSEKDEEVKENGSELIIHSLERIRAKRRELAQDPDSGIVLTEEDLVDISFIRRKILIHYGRSPLHEAVSLRDKKHVKKYLKKKKYLNTRDNNGNTPFEMAKQRQFREIIKIFKCNN